jgi:hypothetical protein
MQHFTRSRFTAAMVALSALATLAAGCAGSTAVPVDGNPAFQQQMPDASAGSRVAQQNLVKDLAALKKDTKTLTKQPMISLDLSTLSAALKAERQDWQSEQSDSCSSVADDARLVAWDAQIVSRDAGTLRGDLAQLQAGDVTSVSNDLTNVQNDLSALKLLGLTPQVTSSAEIAAGTYAVESASDKMTAAESTRNATASTAGQLAASAQDWAKQHAC